MTAGHISWDLVPQYYWLSWSALGKWVVSTSALLVIEKTEPIGICGVTVTADACITLQRLEK